MWRLDKAFLTSCTVERQQSLEEHSVVEGSKDSETLMSSSLSPEQLKKEFKDKKKKHFKVFSRLHKSKEKNSKLDNYLSESLPTQGTAIISAPLVTNSLGTPQPSLASSWDAATWKERRNGSAHSSNASLEMEMSDGEIVESLVNPTRNRLAARLVSDVDAACNCKGGVSWNGCMVEMGM